MAEISTNTTRILIVEDELIIAMDLKRQLEKIGYQICGIASSAQEARQLLQHEQPDIVLLDIRLQGKEAGTVIGGELRSVGEIPFIYITSHYDRATVEEAKNTRPNGYLIKPFSTEDVYVAIEIAIMNFAHAGIDVIDEKEEHQSRSGTIAPKKIKEVVTYIQSNLDKKLTLPDLAAKTGWNTYHFARTFKKYMKESPYKYLLKSRINKAKSMIAISDHSLSQIAGELGFDNYSHFAQTFRKIAGVSPDQYRNTQRPFE